MATTPRPRPAHGQCTHPTDKASRSRCRRARQRSATLVPMIQKALDDVLAANAAQPYSHAGYDAAQRTAQGLIMAYAHGDAEYARALWLGWLDCNEWDYARYRTAMTRDECVYNAGTWADTASRTALEARLGLDSDND